MSNKVFFWTSWDKPPPNSALFHQRIPVSAIDSRVNTVHWQTYGRARYIPDEVFEGGGFHLSLRCRDVIAYQRILFTCLGLSNGEIRLYQSG